MSKLGKEQYSAKMSNHYTISTPSHINLLLYPATQIGLLLLLGFGIYLNTLQAPFILDDFSCITKNPAITRFEYFFDFDKVRALNIPYDIKNNFALRTVPYFTFALNYSLGGLNEFGYHLVNICIHLINAILVYLLVKVTLLRSRLRAANTDSISAIDFIPLLVALLFVVHPLQTHAVTHINQRFTSLATLFYFSALLLYITARLSPKKVLSWLCYSSALLLTVMAMKTKEIAFTLPVALLLYDLFFLEGRIRNRLSGLAPFFLTMAIIPGTIFWRLTTKGIDDPANILEKSLHFVNSNAISPWDYLRTQFGVIVEYLRLLILPVGQNLIHDYPISRSFFAFKTLASFSLLIALFGGAIWLTLRSFKKGGSPTGRLVAFGIFWFFLTIAMSSSIIPLDIMMLEYRVYLPSFGFFFPLVVLAATAADRRAVPYQLFLATAFIIILSLSGATVARNHLYGDEVRILQDVITKSPNRQEARVALSVFYLNSGRYDEAIVGLTEILQALPNDVNMNLNLAFALHDKGRIDDAIHQYYRVLELVPQSSLAHANLGDAFLEKDGSKRLKSNTGRPLNLTPAFFPYVTAWAVFMKNNQDHGKPSNSTVNY